MALCPTDFEILRGPASDPNEVAARLARQMDLVQAALRRLAACQQRKLDELTAKVDLGPQPGQPVPPWVLQGPPGMDGEDGLDGRPGADGRDGQDGLDGRPGTDGEDGDPGSDGRPGRDGDAGEDGRPGLDGEDGQDGTDGRPGPAGDPGEDGRPGPPGDDGDPGEDGRPGRDGIDGVDATGPGLGEGPSDDWLSTIDMNFRQRAASFLPDRQLEHWDDPFLADSITANFYVTTNPGGLATFALTDDYLGGVARLDDRTGEDGQISTHVQLRGPGVLGPNGTQTAYVQHIVFKLKTLDRPASSVVILGMGQVGAQDPKLGIGVHKVDSCANFRWVGRNALPTDLAIDTGVARDTAWHCATIVRTVAGATWGQFDNGAWTSLFSISGAVFSVHATPTFFVEDTGSVVSGKHITVDLDHHSIATQKNLASYLSSFTGAPG